MCDQNIVTKLGEYQLEFEDSILDDLEISRTSEEHNEAFIGGICDRLSPIKDNSPGIEKNELTESVASTPLQCHAVCQPLTRNVKRKRRSISSFSKPKQQTKFDEKPIKHGTGSTSGLSVNSESTDKILCAKKAVIQNYFDSSSTKENAESVGAPSANVIKPADSLQMTTGVHSNFDTSFDNYISSTGVDLSFEAANEMAKKPCFDNQNSFYGLPVKTKEILKQERGIEKLYGNITLDLVVF